MAIASHLGSWLLGTVKNTTGTTAGTIRNTGATHSIQFKAVAYAERAVFVSVVIMCHFFYDITGQGDNSSVRCSVKN